MKKEERNVGFIDPQSMIKKTGFHTMMQIEWKI